MFVGIVGIRGVLLSRAAEDLYSFDIRLFGIGLHSCAGLLASLRVLSFAEVRPYVSERRMGRFLQPATECLQQAKRRGPICEQCLPAPPPS